MAQRCPGGSPTEEVTTNFKKVRERRGAPDDGPKVLEALVEAAKDVKDEDPVIDG
jgi:hypothetical protein